MGNKRVMVRLKVKIGLGVKVFGSTEPFSRVVSWGRDYNNCMRYLKQNILEVLSFIPYTTRKDYYSKRFNMQISESLTDI